MPWIRYTPEETPIAPLKLPTPLGKEVDIQDYRGRTALVIFYSAHPNCPDCRRTLQELRENQAAFRKLAAQILVVLPDTSPDNRRNDILLRSSELMVVFDPQDKLRELLKELTPPSVASEVMLFVLDVFSVPAAAWSGSKPEPKDELLPETLSWLEYLSILCPE